MLKGHGPFILTQQSPKGATVPTDVFTGTKQRARPDFPLPQWSRGSLEIPRRGSLGLQEVPIQKELLPPKEDA